MRAYRDDRHGQGSRQERAAGHSAPAGPAADILALQRMVGNAEVARSVIGHSGHTGEPTIQRTPGGIPVQRVITLHDAGGPAVLSVREICDLLVEQGGGDLPLQVLELMSQQNATGDEATLYGLAGQLAPTVAGQGRTIEDYFAGVVEQRSAQANTQTVWEVEYDQIQKLLADTRLDVDQDAVGHVRNEGIATSGLAPCVAVGLTARLGENRYSALAHWSTITPPEDLFDQIEQNFTGQPGAWPPLAQLDSVKYFAVGGSRDSMKEQAELLEYMIQTGRGPAGVKMVNDRNLRARAKIVVIDRSGHVFYGISPD